MPDTSYTIQMYGEPYRAGILDLLRELWGPDTELNDRYFAWKYEANPYAPEPLGIVAIYREQVVGFRGYFASRWQAGKPTETFIILSPGDTAVHPEHRGAGLSVSMGRFAMSALNDHYRLFLNTSCNQASLPGYLRMGFHPLVNKVYVYNTSPLGLVRFLISRMGLLGRVTSTLPAKMPDPVRVSREPEVAAMADLVLREAHRDARIALVRDAAFFAWRFQNPRSSYVFYYLQEKDRLRAYMVLRLAPDERQAYVVDWACEDQSSLQAITRELLCHRPADLLVVYEFCVDSGVSGLGDVKSTANRLLQRLRRALTSELPLLVRPVTANPSEDNWSIAGRDARRIENWRLLPICGEEA